MKNFGGAKLKKIFSMESLLNLLTKIHLVMFGKKFLKKKNTKKKCLNGVRNIIYN